MSDGSPRILLVEDNPRDAVLLQETLASLDGQFQIAHVERMDQAEQYLKQCTSLDAVLLDLELPDSSGLASLQRANSAAPHLPIIVLTGLEDELVAIEALRAGADYQVKGEIRPRVLARAIHHAKERKRLQLALRDSEERFRTLADASIEGVAIIENGCVIEANDQLARIGGYDSGADVVGRPITDFLAPGEQRRALAGLAGGEPAAGEYFAVKKDGTAMVVELHGRTIERDGRRLHVTAVLDVTERNRAEQLRQQSHQRLEFLSEVASQLLTSDKPQEIVESLCRKVMAHLDCHAFFNYLVDEKAGRLHLNACAGAPPEVVQQIQWLDFGAAVCGCVARDGCPVVAENILQTPDPRTDLVRSFGIQAYACHPLLNQGRVIGTLSFGSRTKVSFREDELALMKAITNQVAIAMQRLRLLESVQQRAAEAQAANVAKSQFLANMSHELRTPMNAILGMTELALGEDLSSAVRDCLRTAKESADSLLELLNEILDFSRIEAGRLELEEAEFCLRSLLDKTLKPLGVRAYEKGLELICDVGRQVPDRLWGDPLRLRQILTNLVANAVKFTQKGEVLVSIRVGGGAESDEIRGAREGRRAGAGESSPPPAHCPSPANRHPSVFLEFAVHDTGIGISSADQQRIFAPFTQADASTTRQYGGTGLGLTIAKNLAVLMGGKLWVESRLGAGSTFRFTVCLGLLPDSDREPETSAALRARLRGAPVLIVDDNPTSRHILEQTLAQWSMKPESATDVPLSLAKIHEAATAGRPFSLVIADAMLAGAGIDGFTLAAWIRGKRSLAGPVILMLSPADRHAAAKQSQELDAIYLEKPISQSDLLAAVSRAVAGASTTVAPVDAAAPRAADAAAMPPSPRRSLRLLLAEDTQANRKLVVRILQKRGHAVAEAENGAEALDLIARENFDLVLMDVQMPVMDGFEATAAIRAMVDPGKARVPIVAITAHALKGDQERCLQAGMDAYLSKPIDARRLIALVEGTGSPAGIA